MATFGLVRNEFERVSLEAVDFVLHGLARGIDLGIVPRVRSIPIHTPPVAIGTVAFPRVSGEIILQRARRSTVHHPQ
jgi:hypothetical protein